MDLHDWAARCALACRRVGMNAEAIAWEQIADRGQEFTPAPLPAGISLMGPGRCYGNSGLTALGATTAPRYGYAEGFALGSLGLWTYHAWNLTSEGVVIDRSWSAPGSRYVGVSFTEDEVRQRGPGMSLILPDNVDLDFPWGNDLQKLSEADLQRLIC